MAGRIYAHSVGKDFAFSDIYEDYAGLTFNPLSQTYFMTENQEDVILEIDQDGILLRTIDIHDVRRAGEIETDAEGITWMYGQTYAMVLEGGEEMAIATITSTTTALSRSNVKIYDLSGDPKGVTYNASEDALYWVSQAGPMRVVKSRINKATGNLDVIFNRDVSALPVSDLADIAYFPRLSPHMILISQSTRTIMEVNLNGASPVVMSTFSTLNWDIPKPGALTFNQFGHMVIVGKHVAETPEDDFSVFIPTGTLENKLPVALVQPIGPVADSNGNGNEPVTLNPTSSSDSDGAIVDYVWSVNGEVVAIGYGPVVPPFVYAFDVGTSTVTLTVRDDALASDTTSILVTVTDPFPNGIHPSAPFRQPDDMPRLSLNYVHPGAATSQAEIFTNITVEGPIRIHVYDALGAEVREIITPAFSPGEYRIPWDLRNTNGSEVASGVYHVIISIPGRTYREKLVVVR